MTGKRPREVPFTKNTPERTEGDSSASRPPSPKRKKHFSSTLTEEDQERLRQGETGAHKLNTLKGVFGTRGSSDQSFAQNPDLEKAKAGVERFQKNVRSIEDTDISLFQSIINHT